MAVVMIKIELIAAPHPGYILFLINIIHHSQNNLMRLSAIQATWTVLIYYKPFVVAYMALNNGT